MAKRGQGEPISRECAFAYRTRRKVVYVNRGGNYARFYINDRPDTVYINLGAKPDCNLIELLFR